VAVLELAEDHGNGCMGFNLESQHQIANIWLIGPSLSKKLIKALLEAEVTKKEFKRFSEQQAESIPDWEKMVIAWEDDHTQPNPYVVAKSGMTCSSPYWCLLKLFLTGVTEADVKISLAQKEAWPAAQGIPAVHETVNASAFIVAGLGLQEHQLVISAVPHKPIQSVARRKAAHHVKNANIITLTQKTELLELRT
jgi:hypothetical protein